MPSSYNQPVANMQFVVAIENAPGALAGLSERLAQRDIDIRALGSAALGKQSLVVLTTSNDDLARQVLRDAGLQFDENEALSATIEDHPGALARLARTLADAGVNIQSVLTIGRRQGKAQLAISVDDPERARKALALI